MAPYQVTIAYDGTEFKGFQRQRSARTVQCELENALKKLGWTERTITSAGRTDSGVHAEGQVIGFQLEWKHSTDDLLNALNNQLPADVRVLRVRYAETDFHPRYSACMRTYRYQIYFAGVENPMLERFFWRVWPKPNLEIMNECTRLFFGRHDFRAYGRPPNSRSSSFRTVHAVNWDIAGDGSQVMFRISADAFLYHMVRRIVNVLVRAGQGRICKVDIIDSLERQLELPAGIAPAKGLILEEIIYE